MQLFICHLVFKGSNLLGFQALLFTGSITIVIVAVVAYGIRGDFVSLSFF